MFLKLKILLFILYILHYIHFERKCALVCVLRPKLTPCNNNPIIKEEFVDHVDTTPYLHSYSTLPKNHFMVSSRFGELNIVKFECAFVCFCHNQDYLLNLKRGILKLY